MRVSPALNFRSSQPHCGAEGDAGCCFFCWPGCAACTDENTASALGHHFSHCTSTCARGSHCYKRPNTTGPSVSLFDGRACHHLTYIAPLAADRASRAASGGPTCANRPKLEKMQHGNGKLEQTHAWQSARWSPVGRAAQESVCARTFCVRVAETRIVWRPLEALRPTCSVSRVMSSRNCTASSWSTWAHTAPAVVRTA